MTGRPGQRHRAGGYGTARIDYIGGDIWPMDDRFETEPTEGCRKRHVLITGSPGVGKTTLIASVAARLPGKKTGFLTREVRRGQIRQGFVIETLDGKTAPLAEANGAGSSRVGKYRVLTESVRDIAVPAIVKDADFVVIDEIGKMETACEAFMPALQRALLGRGVVIATIAGRGSPVIEEVKRRPDVWVFEVTRRNRDSIGEVILERICALRHGDDR